MIQGIAVLIGAGVLHYFMTRYPRKVRRARLAVREKLSMQDLWAQYYPDSSIPPQVMEDALTTIATHIGVDAGRLRPSDVIGDFRLKHLELVSTDFDDLFDDTLAMLPDTKEVWARLESVETVDDYVRALAELKLSNSRPC
jgi:hypothetical protein